MCQLKGGGEINGWDDGQKIDFVAANQMWAALIVLQNSLPSKRLSYPNLTNVLDLQFGAADQMELASTQFMMSRRMWKEEAFPEFVEDLPCLEELDYL